MKRISTWKEAYNTGRVLVDAGDGITLELGDTGWRALPLGDGASGGRVLIRRQGTTVSLKLDGVTLTGSTRALTAVGMNGFSPHDNSPGTTTTMLILGWAYEDGNHTSPWHRIAFYRFGLQAMDSLVAGKKLDGQMTFQTDDTWPATLPGEPA